MLPDIGFDFYPVMLTIGVIVAILVSVIYLKRNKIDKKNITSFELVSCVTCLSGVICSILFQNFYDFIEDSNSYKWTWGMTFYGGLVGGTITFFLLYFLYLKKKDSNILKYILIIAGGVIPLAHAIGRIGCVFDGCCYGKETDSIFGIQFKTTPVKVWPTNLFECIFLFIIAFIILFLVFKYNTRYSLSIYLITYGIFRFCIEFLRGDHRGQFIKGLTPSQFWSIVAFICGVLYLIYLLIKQKKQKQE